MAAKQTRRSISISGKTYARLKAYCVKHERSMSSIVEETLKAAFLDALAPEAKVVEWEGAPPMPPSASATRPPPSKPGKNRPKGGVFTF